LACRSRLDGAWNKVFTGIVERTAVVARCEKTGGGIALEVSVTADASLPPWRQVELGESISVNGACLSAVDFSNSEGGGAVSFEVVPESLEKTALGELEVGVAVNIERSLRVGDFFGGHYVTGHVDGTGSVISIEVQGDQSLFRIRVSPAIAGQMLDKGSVCVDGISLTIIEVCREEGWFSFAAIPHTMERTTLGQAEAGCNVNIETDAFGKWVLHGLQLSAENGSLEVDSDGGG